MTVADFHILRKTLKKGECYVSISFTAVSKWVKCSLVRFFHVNSFVIFIAFPVNEKADNISAFRF